MNTILIALAVWLFGGMVSLAYSRVPVWAMRIGASTGLLGCLIGLCPALKGLLHGEAESYRLAWNIPFGEFHVQLDALSDFFLVPIFGLAALSSLYGASYMMKHKTRRSLGTHWFFFNMFLAGIVLVVVARNALLFMIAWEVMSLSAFFLVTFEHEKKDVRIAGWLYLIAAHVGAAFLLALFLLLGRNAGSLDFNQFMTAPQLTPAFSALVFIIALIGFGTKAGFIPLHIWLPEAHPAAPSHVSALMSGVMIKIGIYGVLRTMMFLGHPANWWGPLLMLIGIAGAVIGVLLALFQSDIKRALAYSSIENIGIIILAFGVGLCGITSGHMLVAMLGFAGGLLHIWNHTMMKGLMFFSAGSILHGSGYKNIEMLGGLMKRMPQTGSAMLIGALCLSAVPPLNGFVSEWLIYMAMLNGALGFSGGSRIGMIIAIGIMALVGGLAMICFVRLIGIALLGEGRSNGARCAHESPLLMTIPMGLIALFCILSSIFPVMLISAFSKVVELVFFIPAATFTAGLNTPQSPLESLVLMNLLIWSAMGGIGLLLFTTVKSGLTAKDSTWGCGYPAPTSRMQYTGNSFSELIVSRLFPKSLKPKTSVIAPKGMFPSGGTMTTSYPDTLSRILYRPFFDWLMERIIQLHWMQMGKIHYYMMYFIVALLMAFSWLVIRKWVMHA